MADPNPIIASYNLKGHALIPEVNPEKKNMKEMVGKFIYGHINKILDSDDEVSKITDMIMDLPLEEIKKVLYDYNYLIQKVKKGYHLLMRELKQQNPQ